MNDQSEYIYIHALRVQKIQTKSICSTAICHRRLIFLHMRELHMEALFGAQPDMWLPKLTEFQPCSLPADQETLIFQHTKTQF